MVGPPRLASARSKVGPGDLRDEVALDVMVDLTEAYPAAVAALSPADEAGPHAHIRALVSDAGAVGPELPDQ